MDLDGAFFEAYFPVGLRVEGCTVNVTNYEYGVWNDFRWDCEANGFPDIIGYLEVVGTSFIGHYQ